MWPRVIVFEAEVFVFEVEYALYIGIKHHSWQLARCAGELQSGLVEVVKIKVGVTRGVDELSRLQTGYLRHHLQKQCIGCNVERNSEECIGRTLVQLQA